MTEKDLLALKSKVDEAKTEVTRLKGKEQYLMQQLKETWDCATVDDAQKLLKKMNKELETMNASIETGMEELEEKYGDVIDG